MTRRFLLLLAICAAGACTLVPRAPPLDVHAVEPPPLASRTAPADVQLAVELPHAGGLLAHDRPVVRTPDGQLAVLDGARFEMPAPELVQTLLVRAFVDGGAFRGVARAGDAMLADVRFASELRAFDADFRRAGLPHVRIELDARLIRTAIGEVIAARTFAADARIESAGARGVIDAFERAFGDLQCLIVDWTVRSIANAAAAGATTAEEVNGPRLVAPYLAATAVVSSRSDAADAGARCSLQKRTSR